MQWTAVSVGGADVMVWLYPFTVTEVTHTRLLLAVTDGAMQYQGPGMELAFPHLDPTDPLLLLQLQHRYTAVCLALKHTLRYNTCRQAHTPFPLRGFIWNDSTWIWPSCTTFNLCCHCRVSVTLLNQSVVRLSAWTCCSCGWSIFCIDSDAQMLCLTKKQSNL